LGRARGQDCGVPINWCEACILLAKGHVRATQPRLWVAHPLKCNAHAPRLKPHVWRAMHTTRTARRLSIASFYAQWANATCQSYLVCTWYALNHGIVCSQACTACTRHAPGMHGMHGMHPLSDARCPRGFCRSLCAWHAACAARHAGCPLVAAHRLAEQVCVCVLAECAAQACCAPAVPRLPWLQAQCSPRSLPLTRTALTDAIQQGHPLSHKAWISRSSPDLIKYGSAGPHTHLMARRWLDDLPPSYATSAAAAESAAAAIEGVRQKQGPTSKRRTAAMRLAELQAARAAAAAANPNPKPLNPPGVHMGGWVSWFRG